MCKWTQRMSREFCIIGQFCLPFPTCPTFWNSFVMIRSCLSCTFILWQWSSALMCTVPLSLLSAYSSNGDKVAKEACGGIGWTLKVYIWQELSVSTMLDTGSSCWEIALLLQPIMTCPRAFTDQSELGFGAIGESALNSAGWKRLSVPGGIWYGHQLAAGT